MPPNDLGEAAFEDRHLQRKGQPGDSRHGIDGIAGGEAFQKPEAALREGERNVRLRTRERLDRGRSVLRLFLAGQLPD